MRGVYYDLRAGCLTLATYFQLFLTFVLSLAEVFQKKGSVGNGYGGVYKLGAGCFTLPTAEVSFTERVRSPETSELFFYLFVNNTVCVLLPLKKVDILPQKKGLFL